MKPSAASKVLNLERQPIDTEQNWEPCSPVTPTKDRVKAEPPKNNFGGRCALTLNSVNGGENGSAWQSKHLTTF